MKRRTMLAMLALAIMTTTTAICQLSDPPNVPRFFNYQGKLTDLLGNPKVGQYNVTFSIQDEVGVEQWTETHTVTLEALDNGLFNVLLGTNTPLDLEHFPLDQDDPVGEVTRWLKVTVDGAELSPTKEFVSVPYAFRASDADTLDGMDSSAFMTNCVEIDPTVTNWVKDGVTWADVKNLGGDMPAGFSDGTDNGVTNWDELKNYGMPAGFADDVDNVGITVEQDPTVTNWVKNGVTWQDLIDFGSMPTGFADNADNIGITAESDPVFMSYPASGITTSDITDWATAYSWGDHSNLWGTIGFIVGQTGSEPYSSVQDAIDAAAAAGFGRTNPVTIEVKPGTYTEGLTFKAGIHVKAEIEDGLFSSIIEGHHRYDYNTTGLGLLFLSGIQFKSPTGTSTNPTFSISGDEFTSIRMNHCVLTSRDNGPALQLSNTGTQDGRLTNTEMYDCRIRNSEPVFGGYELVSLEAGSLLMKRAEVSLIDLTKRSFMASGTVTRRSELKIDNAEIKGQIETAGGLYGATLLITQSSINSTNLAGIVHNGGNAVALDVIFISTLEGDVVTGSGVFFYNSIAFFNSAPWPFSLDINQTLADSLSYWTGALPIGSESAFNVIYRATTESDWTGLFPGIVPDNVNTALDMLVDVTDRHIADTDNPHNVTLTQLGYSDNNPEEEAPGPSGTERGEPTGTEIQQWADDITAWGHTNMVTDLNADMLDGLQASELARVGHTHSHSNLLYLDADDHPQYIEDWNELIATETVPDDFEDGYIEWAEVSNRPPFVTVEIDPQVGTNQDNYVPRWGSNVANEGVTGALVKGEIYDPGTGNIGIGTDDPKQTLHIATGGIMFPDSSVQTTALVAAECLWTETGNDIYRDTGNVGIGTTSPDGKLDVRGATRIGDNGYFNFHYGNEFNTENGNLYVQYRRASDGSTAYAGNTLINVHSGNVGIGTTGPGAKLHVVGSTRTDRMMFGVTDTAGVGGDYYSIYRETGAWNHPYPDLVIQYHTGIKYDAYSAYGGHRFYTGYDGSGNPTGLKLSIDDNVIVNSGNVGIGTTSPEQKLDVAGNLRLSPSNPYLYTGGSYLTIPYGLYVSGGTPYFQNQIQARGGIHNDMGSYLTIAGGTIGNTYFSGNVGVGIPNPKTKLQVKGVIRLSSGDYRIESDPDELGANYPFLALRAYPPPGYTAKTVLVPAKTGFRVTDYENVNINFELYNSGDLWIRGSLAQSSDSRGKLNLKPLEYGLVETLKLQTWMYDRAEFTIDPETGELDVDEENTEPDIGMSAQETYEIIPEAVRKPEDESKERWGIKYSKIVTVLVKAVQEQQEEIESLKTRIKALEAK